jgi:geranylgeranyl diphosphate synthase type I
MIIARMERGTQRLSYRDFMAREKGHIEDEIDKFFDEEIRSSPEDGLVRRVLGSLKEFTSRDAKRVRAVLLIMGYIACGGKDMPKARRASISMELVQTMLLIHDDLMDGSDMRRGGPSFHRMFSDLQGPGIHDGGANMAIIAGDLAESLAEKVLASSLFHPDLCLRALTLQSEMVRDTGYGQILDVSSGLQDIAEDRILATHLYKTARYTFEGPLTIGGTLAGGENQMIRALSGYAIPVGISFQIIDDILGFLGDPKKGGSEDISDLREGKGTFVILDLLSRCGSDERALIERSIGNPEMTRSDAEMIRAIAQRHEVLSLSRERARIRVEEGIASLHDAGLDRDIVALLSEFAYDLLRRA